MPKLACYLLRDDGEWYALGDRHRWHFAFVTFPGPDDGATRLAPEDARVLSLRLDGYGHDQAERERIAADVIRWAAGKFFRFKTELDPEIEPDVLPTPITGRCDL